MARLYLNHHHMWLNKRFFDAYFVFIFYPSVRSTNLTPLRRSPGEGEVMEEEGI